MINAQKKGDTSMTIELRAQLYHDEEPQAVIDELEAALSDHPHILSEPGPAVQIDQYNLVGTVLSVRVHCQREHYWAVFLAVGEEIGLRGTPRSHSRIRMKF